jgi:hypothetical protein
MKSRTEKRRRQLLIRRRLLSEIPLCRNLETNPNAERMTSIQRSSNLAVSNVEFQFNISHLQVLKKTSLHKIGLLQASWTISMAVLLAERERDRR